MADLDTSALFSFSSLGLKSSSDFIRSAGLGTVATMGSVAVVESLGGMGPPAGIVTRVDCPAVTDAEGWMLDKDDDEAEVMSDAFRLLADIPGLADEDSGRILYTLLSFPSSGEVPESSDPSSFAADRTQ